MDFQLLTIENEDLEQYKVVLQEAFQKGFEEQFGKMDKIILPEKDIEQSLNSKGAVAYKAVVDGKMVGVQWLLLMKRRITTILICFL